MKNMGGEYVLVNETDWGRKTEDGCDNCNYGKNYWMII